MDPTIILRWDIHEASAPHDSDRWAASDRGWLFAEVFPSPLRISVTGTTYVCVGHYLDYGKEHREGKPAVHAHSCVTRDSRYFETPAEAQAWILQQARGKVPDYFADQHRGYEHQKAAYRRMTCDETPRESAP